MSVLVPNRGASRRTPPDNSALVYSEPSWGSRLRRFWRDADGITLANLPDHLASLYGDRTVVRMASSSLLGFPGLGDHVTVNYEQLADSVARTAGGLASLGVGRGDRVALMTMNRFEMLFVALAAARLGAIPVPLNYLLRPDEVDAITRRAEARVFVTDRAVFSGVLRDPSSVPTVKQWFVIDEPIGGESLIDATMASEPVPPVPVKESDPALIFFTSGTTGVPKGATLSHAAATVGGRYHGRVFALKPRMGRPLVLSVMPVAHVGGYAALITYMAIGWPILFCPQFDPAQILDLMEQWSVTAFTGTPAMYQMLLDAGAEDRDLTSVRVWGGGADAFSDDVVRRFRDASARRGPLGWKRRPMFIRGYGMAESNGYVAQSPPMPMGDRCVGWVMPPVRHRIVDQSGTDVPRGTPGQLLLAGPTIATNYWNDPETTTAHFNDGWFQTGDVVQRGRLGMLYFVDRSRDMIKSGGYKIAAAEVDHVMEAHPSVLHAATVGLPHDQLGEEAVTAVVVRPGVELAEAELLRWVRTRLAGPKCPRRIVFVGSLPLTFSLKPKRREVQAMLARRAAREGAAR